MTRPESGRFFRYMAGPGTIHLMLLACSAIFLFPFLWMVGTSLKTDEEIPENRLMPKVPVHRPSGPYVRSVPAAEPPANARTVWEALAPDITERARQAVSGVTSVEGIDRLEPALWQSAATFALLRRVFAGMPENSWKREVDVLREDIVDRLQPSAAREAVESVVARLELRSVQIQNLDGMIHPVWTPSAGVEPWSVRGPGAALVPSRQGGSAWVAYDFSRDPGQPIVLQTRFTLPVAMEDLHKVIVSIRPDDSWHRVEIRLRAEGRQWESARTSYLAQHRSASLVFQPPTFDDETFRARTWVGLRDVGSAPHGEAVLEIIIRPSSTVQAILGKVLRNYLRASDLVPFWTYVGNSLLLVVLSTAGALFSASLVGYAFARLNWPGRGAAFLILLSTMMLPPQVTMVPQFMIWKELGWYNTLNPLWVPAWLGSAFFIFLMVQAMKGIPRELEEAAQIDGLNRFQTWWHVIMPQVKPTLAAITVMSFLGAWNEFMGPLIYLRDQAKFPLSLGLFGFRLDGTTGGDWTVIMAGNVLMTLPVIILFFLCQRHFIQGMTSTAVKG
jgi:ABC-type glycerol-3-phosphate transport system permease component